MHCSSSIAKQGSIFAANSHLPLTRVKPDAHAVQVEVDEHDVQLAGHVTQFPLTRPKPGLHVVQVDVDEHALQLAGHAAIKETREDIKSAMKSYSQVYSWSGSYAGTQGM